MAYADPIDCPCLLTIRDMKKLIVSYAAISVVGYQVVPGQSVFLRSGREALLVETNEDSNALVVVGTGGKANVVEENTKGKLTKLPLSVLKDSEAVAALAAGEQPPGPSNGEDLAKQVRGVVQQHHHFQ